MRNGSDDPRLERGLLDLRNAIPALQGSGSIKGICFALVERLLGFHRLDRLFTQASYRETPESYFGHLSEEFELAVSETGPGVAGIPESGPAIIAANHPFGGVDAMTVAALAFRRRPDTLVISNEFMYTVEPLKSLLIPVDVYGGHEARRKNLRGLREAANHLAKGGQLVIFPAGEVASWSWREGRVSEAPWGSHLGALAKRSGARIIPVFLPGQNSWVFQVMGMIHPSLRTAWLGRELLRQRGASVELRIGRPLCPDPDSDAEAITEAARQALEGLAEGSEP